MSVFVIKTDAESECGAVYGKEPSTLMDKWVNRGLWGSNYSLFQPTDLPLTAHCWQRVGGENVR